MGREDWYRNTDWNEEIEAAYFDKLSRARSSRDQYLTIQASLLARTHPDVAMKLVDLYFNTKKTNFDVGLAFGVLVEVAKSKGQWDKVVETYKQLLELEKAKPSQTFGTDIELPYFVATHKIKHEYSNCLEVLKSINRDMIFPLERFKYYSALALISMGNGQRSAAKNAASCALQEADLQRSGLRYHQNLGLVGEDHRSTIRKLVQISKFGFVIV